MTASLSEKLEANVKEQYDKKITLAYMIIPISIGTYAHGSRVCSNVEDDKCFLSSFEMKRS